VSCSAHRGCRSLIIVKIPISPHTTKSSHVTKYLLFFPGKFQPRQQGHALTAAPVFCCYLTTTTTHITTVITVYTMTHTEYDTSQLPALGSADFSNIVSWDAAIHETLRRIHPKPNFPASAVIEPAVIDLCLAIAAVTSFPDGLEEATKLLYKTFRPSSATAQLAIVKRVRWAPPPPRAGEYTTSSSLIAFNSEFGRIITALAIEDASAIKLYIEALHGNVARLVNNQLRLTTVSKLEDIFKLSVSCAARVDAANADRLLPAPMTTTVPKPKDTKATAPTTTTSRFPHKLTPADYNRCVAEGRCLRCRQKGHATASCPVFNSTPQSTTHTPPIPAAVARPATPALAQQTSAAQPRYPVRTKHKPDFFRPGIQAQAVRVSGGVSANTVDMQPQRHQEMPRSFAPSTSPETGDTVAVQTVSEMQTPSSDGDTAGTFNTNQRDGRIYLLVDLAVKSLSTRTQLHCLLDTGADRSEINKDYARALGLELVPCPEIAIQVADGRTEVCCHEALASVRFARDAPIRQVRFLVTASTPPGPYALIGIADLQGYSITIADQPVVEWRGLATTEDLADPLEPPEPLVSLDDCQPRQQPPVKIGDKLNPEERSAVEALLREFSDVFGALNDQPAKLRPFAVKLVADAHPIRTHPRYLSAEKRAFFSNEIERLLNLGIIRPSSSPWAAPLTFTTKRNGKFRMCIDYTLLNQVTIKDAYPIPLTYELFDFLAGKPYLASFDLTMVYYQVPVEKTSIATLAFTTPLGLFEPTRLPFGVTNGPPHFQREISTWIRPLSDIERSFFDDCGIAVRSFDNFLDALRQFLDACRESNIKLNAEKSVIGPRGSHSSVDSLAQNPSRSTPNDSSLCALPLHRRTRERYTASWEWLSGSRHSSLQWQRLHTHYGTRCARAPSGNGRLNARQHSCGSRKQYSMHQSWSTSNQDTRLFCAQMHRLSVSAASCCNRAPQRELSASSRSFAASFSPQRPNTARWSSKRWPLYIALTAQDRLLQAQSSSKRTKAIYSSCARRSIAVCSAGH